MENTPTFNKAARRWVLLCDGTSNRGKDGKNKETRLIQLCADDGVCGQGNFQLATGAPAATSILKHHLAVN
ncbi:hypothetical protein T265_08777 [Opisthorchis viverrini]|uniref:DUF2235 domain-containing protein n=1 Tax=Opisthorchis viverrini TaxID=6198 RepID=A0A075A771_OPIVI|nr:hypothetical protein T265_08777 [Opisthorchis viverrini]KER23289.1 hypothetical protein T265_08777 [Opisthorchis viverrini]